MKGSTGLRATYNLRGEVRETRVRIGKQRCKRGKVQYWNPSMPPLTASPTYLQRVHPTFAELRRIEVGP